MRRGSLLFGAAIALGCRSPAPVAGTPAPSPQPAEQPVMVRTRVVADDTFQPAGGDAALRAFIPDVQPVEIGGECRLIRTGGSGATITTAYFPSFDSAHTVLSVTFDSAGHLVRFYDRRGHIRFGARPSMSDAQLDSARRAAEAATRSTSISFDYAVDQAVASNRGGGRPSQAVIAPVRSMESLEKLGPPTKRLQHVRRLCGV